jgi:cell division protein FtsB
VTASAPRHAAPKTPPPVVVVLARARVRAEAATAVAGRATRRRAVQFARGAHRHGVALVEGWRAQSLQQRRSRALLGSAALFALIVLATSFPAAALLSQRGQLASDAGQLATLRQQDAALTRQVAQLRKPSTIDGLARKEYGLVHPGQKAYTILPPSSGTPAVIADSGGVPLDGPPVEPGSGRAQQLTGVPPVTAAGGHAHHRSDSAGSRDRGANVPQTPPPGFWSRVVRNLEFWN